MGVQRRILETALFRYLFYRPGAVLRHDTGQRYVTELVGTGFQGSKNDRVSRNLYLN
jgi:hypothetical protein